MESSLKPEHEFEILDGCLCKIETATGRVVARHRPIGTSVVQVLASGHNIVVREDYYQFPRGQSNVYCVTKDFELVWFAELPFANDVYANPVTTTPTGLHCASWDCMSCTLSPETGRIVKKVFTK